MAQPPASQTRDDDTYLCVCFNKEGKVVQVRVGDRIVEVSKEERKCEKILKEYLFKLRWCQGHGGGSDPCCFWDDAAGEERCWC